MWENYALLLLLLVLFINHLISQRWSQLMTSVSSVANIQFVDIDYLFDYVLRNKNLSILFHFVFHLLGYQCCNLFHIWYKFPFIHKSFNDFHCSKSFRIMFIILRYCYVAYVIQSLHIQFLHISLIFPILLFFIWFFLFTFLYTLSLPLFLLFWHFEYVFFLQIYTELFKASNCCYVYGMIIKSN